MRISKIKLLFAAGCTVAVVGVLTLFVFWNDMRKNRPGRGIAQAELVPVPKTIDAGGDYIRNVKIRMIQNSSAEVLGDDVHFHFGAFETASAGSSRDVCEDFSHVEITVRAEGVAINGEPVEKTFSQACEHAVASETIAPVIVPVAELKKFAAEEAGFWPEEWHVSEVKLSDVQTGRTIDADGYEIVFVLGHPLGVKF